MVEMMAAALSGATLSANASSFGGNEGGSPRTGQFFIAIDPGPFSAGGYDERMTGLVAAITGQDGARMPGSRRQDARPRIARDGVTFARTLHEKLLSYRA